jgi:hypothetical protein
VLGGREAAVGQQWSGARRRPGGGSRGPGGSVRGPVGGVRAVVVGGQVSNEEATTAVCLNEHEEGNEE